MLLQLGVPIFNTVLHNAKLGFYTRLSCSTEVVIGGLRLINYFCTVHELSFHFFLLVCANGYIPVSLCFMCVYILCRCVCVCFFVSYGFLWSELSK